MGFLLFDPNPYPDVNSSASTQPKILTANFGDNYRQDATDGINALAQSFAATWTNLTFSEGAAIMAALTATQGVQPFYFKLPNKSYWQKWKVPGEIKETFPGGQYESIQCTFVEVFDIDSNVISAYGGVPANALQNSAGAYVIDQYGNYVLQS